MGRSGLPHDPERLPIFLILSKRRRTIVRMPHERSNECRTNPAIRETVRQSSEHPTGDIREPRQYLLCRRISYCQRAPSNR
jgi:hypothetical protein